MKDLILQLDRVGELINNLEIEYENSLNSKTISEKAKIITHEIFEKLSNILDQTAYKIWEIFLSKNLTEKEKSSSRIYFPAASDEKGLLARFKEWKVEKLNEYINKLSKYSSVTIVTNGFKYMEGLSKNLACLGVPIHGDKKNAQLLPSKNLLLNGGLNGSFFERVDDLYFV